jgi:hypothetical protein
LRNGVASPTFEVWQGDQLLAEAEAGNEALIGASEQCDVPFPAEIGLPALWAVIARTNRGWELHSLTNVPFSRDGAELGTQVVFRGADIVEQQFLRFIFKPAADTPGESDPASRGSDPSLYLDPLETGELAPTDIRETTFYLRCTEVCSKVTAGLKEAEKTDARQFEVRRWLRRLLRRWKRPKDPVDELFQFESDLARWPDDHERAHDLALFFDRMGFDNLYGSLLIELFKRQPRNVELLLELADVYSRRARQSDRPHFARVQSATEAYTCLVQAQKLQPGPDMAARVKQAAAEMMLLKSTFSSSRK